MGDFFESAGFGQSSGKGVLRTPSPKGSGIQAVTPIRLSADPWGLPERVGVTAGI